MDFERLIKTFFIAIGICLAALCVGAILFSTVIVVATVFGVFGLYTLYFLTAILAIWFMAYDSGV